MLTDPVADMLARIRNANKALHEHTEMPTSRLKEGIARILKEEGYITDFHVNTEPGGKPQGAPVTHIRVDVAPGLSTDPQAVPECKPEEFGTREDLMEKVRVAINSGLPAQYRS